MSSVGIFWHVHNALVFRTIKIDHLKPDSLGLIDAPFTHIEEWEVNHIYCKFGLKLSGTEYTNYPRGRVIYDQQSECSKVFIDTSIFKKHVINEIVSNFALNSASTKWFSDPHYKSI